MQLGQKKKKKVTANAANGKPHYISHDNITIIINVAKISQNMILMIL